MLAPAGLPGCRLKDRVWGGISVSIAVAVTVTVLPTITSWSLIEASTGDVLAGSTWTLKLLMSDSCGDPLSVTLTVTTYEPGACAAAGDQVKTPCGVIVAPEGEESREKVST